MEDLLSNIDYYVPRPNYVDDLIAYLKEAIYPFRLTDVTIWLVPDLVYGHTGINMEARNLPGVIFKADMAKARWPLIDEIDIAAFMAEEYAKTFKALYLEPEDHIQLGEN